MQNEITLVERDYFKEPFSEEEIREMAAIAGIDQIFAKRSPSLKQMGLAGRTCRRMKWSGSCCRNQSW